MKGVKNIPPCCFTASPIRKAFSNLLSFVDFIFHTKLGKFGMLTGDDLKSIHPKVAKIEKYCTTPNTVSFYYTFRQLSC